MLQPRTHRKPNPIQIFHYLIRLTPSTRVLIIHSSKPGSFCAGADLKERRGMSDEDITIFLDELNDLCRKIETLRMPTIAAIDGPALGGGLEIALACDIRVAGHAVDKIGLPECRMGIIPGAGGTQRLPRLIGVPRAKELIFTGRILDSNIALVYGVWSYLVLTRYLADEPRSGESCDRGW
jgi:methylglutaconyl-CoA hydratase